MKVRQNAIKVSHVHLSKRQRAKLLNVHLSSCYKKPQEKASDTTTIMNEIQDIYATRPFQGYRRITWDLKDLGYVINHKKVYRLMKQMGLQAVYPKKNLSKRCHEHKVYPYLLKAQRPMKPHDAWCIDITYIKITTGFIYLTALIDVVSRYVVGFHISPFLDTESCLQALEMAVSKGDHPKIINSDQGCQFTSQEWTYQVTLLGSQISMDGRGRALDNIPIERFWRTIKYEDVYFKTYDSVNEAKEAIARYIRWYNHERRYSGLGYHRPYDVMIGLQKALTCPFSKADGYVDNGEPFPHIPTATTMKQQKVTLTMNLSSNIAA